MFRTLQITSKCILAAALVLGMFIPVASAKKAKPEQVLYDFCSQANCSDGNGPGDLIMDSSGNFYGTATEGGNGDAACYEGCGVVFKLAADGTETVLYSFCSQANCSDGAAPYAGLIMDGSGNLYGTTAAGGNGNAACQEGCGVVFKLAPDGTETVLYGFCSQANCSDGDAPYAGLIMDGAGNLYGTTFSGGLNVGCSTGCGTVFKIAPDGTETVLHSFCPEANCTDGDQPMGGLIMDGSGNLYGTTSNGGFHSYCCGTVFELAPDGTETVLYAFGQAQTDGIYPLAGVTMDGAGNLYGTTSSGLNEGVLGTVFKLAPDGTETALHDFTGGSDGAALQSGVILDSAGNVYGTTDLGGSTCCDKHAGAGTAFELAPDGTETQLYIFKSRSHGKYPTSGLITDSQGNLYDSASAGKYNGGVVFKINIDATAKR